MSYLVFKLVDLHFNIAYLNQSCPSQTFTNVQVCLLELRGIKTACSNDQSLL